MEDVRSFAISAHDGQLYGGKPVPAGSEYRTRYRGEADEFEAVVRPHVPLAMWSRLERALA